MDPSFKGKLVLVTGSTSGIGCAIAKAFVLAGDTVVVNGRHQSTVDSTVEILKALDAPGHAIGLAGDISTKEGCEALCKGVDELHRPLEVLVNNTGVFSMKDFWDSSDGDWEEIFQANFFSNVRLCRHFLKKMLDRNQGRVVMISSEQAVTTNPQMLHYATSKTAQVGLAHGLAQLTKGTSVTVNSVIVGPTWTEGVERQFGVIAEMMGTTSEDFTKGLFADNWRGSLLQRMMKPEEVASTILFLASEAAACINGSALRVDGGLIQHT